MVSVHGQSNNQVNIRKMKCVANCQFAARNHYLLQWILPPMKYRDGENRALRSKREYNERKERARTNLGRVLRTLGFADWMVIYMVARNIDRALFTTLALALDPPGFGYYAAEEEESEEDDDNNNV